MQSPIALFDLDDTLADYEGAHRRGQEQIASPYDFERLRTIKRGEEPDWYEERRRMITGQPGWFRELRHRDEGFALFNLAKTIGFSNHILTKGPGRRRQAWTEKAEWCDLHVPGCPVHVVSDKGLVYGRVLVDDWPPYGLAWLEWRKRGLLVLPAQSWNEGFEHPNAIRFTGDNYFEVRERMKAAFYRDTASVSA